MIYKGNKICAQAVQAEGLELVVELVFNATDNNNLLDTEALHELAEILDQLEGMDKLSAVLLTSGKEHFILGADINEFPKLLSGSKKSVNAWIGNYASLFERLESLPVPTLAAINGMALGGGLETALACDFRFAAKSASVGLPESSLGIMPGFGGTVRLPRLIGADNAINIMVSAQQLTADEALRLGVVDAVVADGELYQAALTFLHRHLSESPLDRGSRELKLSPLRLSVTERAMLFEYQRAKFRRQAATNPAVNAIINSVERGAEFGRQGAANVECQVFSQLAMTSSARAQIGAFLADKKIKRTAKALAEPANKLTRSAVLGAGIMGAGIAYVSAIKGIEVIIKDILPASLESGSDKIKEWLEKDVKRGKRSAGQALTLWNNVSFTTYYDELKDCDIVTEAVVENIEIKARVLTELEQVVNKDTLIASNTSTIAINQLAGYLKHPHRFCGMHYFNPVPQMALVEIIRGKQTSEQTIIDALAFARAQGKVPIVVNDCPGFYINRVLFPYLAAFSLLLLEGVDFTRIDRVMEQEFGWPMGPAWLADVIGIDTLDHCTDVMAEGFPERMPKIKDDPISLLYQAGRLGVKRDKGFYQYSIDKRGKSAKQALELPIDPVDYNREIEDADIIYRLMIPMVNEVLRCLDEGIVGSAEEADMGLVYALGFPRFRGGPLRYLDATGLDEFIEAADRYRGLGEIYQVPESLRLRAAASQTIYA
ncbi:fatty acid oxidation complex subunit alpha FadB [Shewanella corallii]|uniref:enoyl-CoA hydratase n=1 Tax=Shewanella corallii TaxID=560080 RepID=A0ABT0NAN5_9GAMM|nr:fatty acid oxidation complex subunit alpha FadB [Shewanella corallii]MCL2915521.1 fatty acid oxidation complex subunit alpha FadB [Shewanella corallii]